MSDTSFVPFGFAQMTGKDVGVPFGLHEEYTRNTAQELIPNQGLPRFRACRRTSDVDQFPKVYRIRYKSCPAAASTLVVRRVGAESRSLRTVK